MKPSDSDWAYLSHKIFLLLNAPLPPLTFLFVIILSLNLKGREEMTPSVSFIHSEVPVLIFFPTVPFAQISAAWRDGVTARLFLLPPRFRGVFKFDFADNFKVASPPDSPHLTHPFTEPPALLWFLSWCYVAPLAGILPPAAFRGENLPSVAFLLWRPNLKDNYLLHRKSFFPKNVPVAVLLHNENNRDAAY